MRYFLLLLLLALPADARIGEIREQLEARFGRVHELNKYKNGTWELVFESKNVRITVTMFKGESYLERYENFVDAKAAEEILPLLSDEKPWIKERDHEWRVGKLSATWQLTKGLIVTHADYKLPPLTENPLKGYALNGALNGF
jgi:hypothetical protein